MLLQEEDVRDGLQHSKRSKPVDDLPPLGPADPYSLMSYLGLPATFRPWSPSSKLPGGGYPPFPPCFSGTVPYPSRPPHTGHPSSLEVVRGLDSERSISPSVSDSYRRSASSPPLLAAPPIKRQHLLEKG